MYRCAVNCADPDNGVWGDSAVSHPFLNPLKCIAKRSASDHEVLIVLAELKTPNMPSASKGIYGYAFQSQHDLPKRSNNERKSSQ